ncbi:helix-turn-helix domain-containing protein [Phaeospirillum tilakii]|uniref:Helix-turn-helix domain-containing protein n=1 Tax=Phaeospirillum tilakii TaxID=741673 RepID=A0ABW5C9D6_9PROT
MNAEVSLSQPERMSDDEKLLYRMRFRHETYKKLDALFRRLAVERGLTQKAIAEILGVSESLISKRLNGQANMTMDTLCDLARAMGARLQADVVLLEDVKPAIADRAAAGHAALQQAIADIPKENHAGLAFWRKDGQQFRYTCATTVVNAVDEPTRTVQYAEPVKALVHNFTMGDLARTPLGGERAHMVLR